MWRPRRSAGFLVIALAVTAYWAVGGGAAKLAVETGVDFGLGPAMVAADDWLGRARTRIDPAIEAAENWLTRAGTALGLGSLNVEEPSYRFAEVVRGDVLSSVLATGTVTPVTTVLVGTQVSGQIMEIPADFNTSVRRGDVIALIDPVSYEIAVDQAAADLEVAEATVVTAEADVLRARADLDIASATRASAGAEAERMLFQVKDFIKDMERKTVLAAKGNVAAAERDRAEAALDMARAQYDSLLAQQKAKEAAVRAARAAVKAAESRVANAQAMVRQKQAALRQHQTDLDRTVIRAPVDGVVINRDVDAGQTVTASLQAPTLFMIARDLREMQVQASIDESEIGRITPGQDVQFTVDAYPDRRFAGKVTQIRLAPRTVQNVVTYTVIVTADNPELLLLPGMTATARFLVAEKRDVLTVPTAALRVRMPGATSNTGQSRLWIEEGGTLRHIQVEVGLTDGTEAEVSGPGLEEGQRIVVGIDAVKRERSAAKRLIGAF
jgi:HlyD family secretion protein